MLAKIGCVATIRPLRINNINREPMLNAIGSIPELTPERLVHLAGEEKKILMKYGLTTLNFKTMCHACRCCDIVPFVDSVNEMVPFSSFTSDDPYDLKMFASLRSRPLTKLVEIPFATWGGMNILTIKGMCTS